MMPKLQVTCTRDSLHVLNCYHKINFVNFWTKNWNIYYFFSGSWNRSVWHCWTMMSIQSWPGSDTRTVKQHYYTAAHSVDSNGWCKIPEATTRTGILTTATPRPEPAWLWASPRWQGHPESITWVRPSIWYCWLLLFQHLDCKRSY